MIAAGPMTPEARALLQQLFVHVLVPVGRIAWQVRLSLALSAVGLGLCTLIVVGAHRGPIWERVVVGGTVVALAPALRLGFGPLAAWHGLGPVPAAAALLLFSYGVAVAVADTFLLPLRARGR